MKLAQAAGTKHAWWAVTAALVLLFSSFPHEEVTWVFSLLTRHNKRGTKELKPHKSKQILCHQAQGNPAYSSGLCNAHHWCKNKIKARKGTHYFVRNSAVQRWTASISAWKRHSHRNARHGARERANPAPSSSQTPVLPLGSEDLCFINRDKTKFCFPTTSHRYNLCF